MAQEIVEPEVKKLPSGKTYEMRPFKGRDIKDAIKIANGDAGNLTFAILAKITLVNGKQIVLEDIDDMDGADVLALMTEYGNFTQSGSQK